MLTTTVVAGLLSGRLGYMDGTGIAFAGLHFELTAPVYLGDTIHCEVEITAHKPSSSKPDRGFMEWTITVLNQGDEVVARGTWELIVARRPT
jgi:acyl dehydratase